MDHGPHGHEDVLVDQPGESLLILLCVTRAMDYSHLLDEGALATLSCTLWEGGRNTRNQPHLRRGKEIFLFKYEGLSNS